MLRLQTLHRYIVTAKQTQKRGKTVPTKIAWLDKKLHIYDIVLSDPFTLDDQNQFYVEFFKFMDAAPAPTFGLFDLSSWSQSGAAGLNDPRFRQMANYREKIIVIVMVTKSKVTAAMGRLGTVVIGHGDWMRFMETRQEAIDYLTTHAKETLAQRELPQEDTTSHSPKPLVRKTRAATSEYRVK